MRTVYDADLLLVDDNPDLLRLLSDQLSGAGYRHIRTAANCAAAQTAFACKTPELMILDIKQRLSCFYTLKSKRFHK